MTSPQAIRDLAPHEIETAAFLRLLWFAVEVDDDRLRTIRDVTLPRLTVIGSADSEVIAFAAYHVVDTVPVDTVAGGGASAVPGPDRGRPAAPQACALIEYIAVAEQVRGQRWGTRLIEAIADRHPELPIHAQTDDDAVGFYRRVGFEISSAPRDPRWPERRRYDCELPSRLDREA